MPVLGVISKTRFFFSVDQGGVFCAVNVYKNPFQKSKEEVLFSMTCTIASVTHGLFLLFPVIIYISWSVLQTCFHWYSSPEMVLSEPLNLELLPAVAFKRAEICGSNELSGFFLICFEVSNVRGSVEGILCIWFCHTSFASALSHKSTY